MKLFSSPGGIQRHLARALVSASLSAFAVATAFPARAQTSTSYSLVEVGRLTGTDTSYPNAINADDATNVKVVGDTGTSGFKKHAFYWSTSTGLRDIGVLGAGSYSQAFSVNRSGEVVGQSATTSTGGYSHAIYWNPGRGSQGPVDLTPTATPSSTWVSSGVYSINDSGVIVGYVYDQQLGRLWVYWTPISPGVYGAPVLLTGLPNAAMTAEGPGLSRAITPTSDIVGDLPDAMGVHHAVVWKNANPLTPANPSYATPTVIPVPAGASTGVKMSPGIMTVATLLNGSTKLLVAGSWYDGVGYRAWVWAEGDTSATDIGILSSTYSTQIWGLNDLGQVSGHSSISTSSGIRLRAVAWAPGTGLLNLGTLGGTESRAYGTSFNGLGYTINHAGQVVGYSKTNGDKDVHAFLWTSSAGMRDLNSTTLTPNKGPFSVLRDAAGITDNGYITGSGLYTVRGKTYKSAYLLIPSG